MMGNEEESKVFVKTLLEKTEGWPADKMLACAIQHLEAFVGANFAGVQTNIVEEEDLILSDESFIAENFRYLAFKELSFGTNTPFAGARQITELWLARWLIERVNMEEFKILLWKFRLYHIWSMILNEREIQIKREMDKLADSLQNFIVNYSKEMHLEFLLERAQSQLIFLDYAAAKQSIDEATRLAGIAKLGLSGALGKRTHFQQKSVAQLTLQLELKPDAENRENAGTSLERNGAVQQPNYLPHNCKSGDDTLLEQVHLDESCSHQQLSQLQTACILAKTLWERQANNSVRELSDETALVFLEEVIRQRSCWSLQTRALVERSRLEMLNSRRVDRAAAQLGHICKLLDDPGDQKQDIAASGQKRLDFLFASGPLPFWEVSKLHARVLLSLGCISDALRIFERLQSWNDVVNCHLGAGQPEKAESLIRKLLEEKDDPNYFCLLGDITNNADLYWKAIELSKDSSARARASLGKMFLAKKEYVEAATHFERSLEIRPLQLGIWFNFGFVSMKAANFKNAIMAYHRCVSIEPEHFEAWNNLAASYIHDNQKSRAQKILQEALKLNWENAQVWENFLLVSVDIGDFKQAVIAMEKLLGLDQKRPLDELPLEIICTEILKQNEQRRQELQSQTSDMKKSILAILARTNSRQLLSPKLLRIYALLKRPEEGSGDCTAWSAYIQLLEKAFQKQFEQITTSKAKDKHEELFRHLLEFIDELQAFWRLQKLQPLQMKTQLQLRLRPAIGFLEQEFGADCEQCESEELLRLFKRAKEMLA